MTREEAIAFFKDMNECTYENLKAVEMAIKALEQQPCDDCISRQAAIETAKQHWYKPDIAGALEELPSVKPKTGHWIKITPSGIYMCSECEQNVLTGDIDAYHYCHHCGTRMIGLGLKAESEVEE
jgi:DNA-directed RNA polymerase subunit RPC12/RpoP